MCLSAIPAFALGVDIKGTETNRYGRVLFEFDAPTKLALRNANGIVVITFPEAVTIKTEKLEAELAGYISVVRRDPDGKGLRFALTKPFKTNILEAGERIYVDFLPETWTGLPPPLPQSVVAELARRAREAEAKLRVDIQRRQTETPKPIAVRVAQLPSLTRIVFEPPGLVDIKARMLPDGMDLIFEGFLSLDAAKLKAALPPSVRAVTADLIEGVLAVNLTFAPGFEAKSFREDEAFVVDLSKVEVKPNGQKVVQTPFSDLKPVADLKLPKAADGATPKAEAMKPAADAAPAPATLPVAEPDRIPAGPVRPLVTSDADSLKIELPFHQHTAAAAFERGGFVTAVFHTSEPVDSPAKALSTMPAVQFQEMVREGAFTILRLKLVKPQLTRLSPSGNGWALTIGDKAEASSELIAVTRAVDESGRTVLKALLPQASGVHWIDSPDNGERMAVATAFGQPHSIAKLQRFAEFKLLPTAHGVVVVADADDVTVHSALDEVVVSRGSGLSLTFGADPISAAGSAKAFGDPAIKQDKWVKDQAGDVLSHSNEWMLAAVEAPRSGRTGAYIDLAGFLMANRLNSEAAGVLKLSLSNDPSLDRQRSFALLHAINDILRYRDAEARKTLAADFLVDDPEAVLWRSTLDARQKRWQQALAGFRRSDTMLDTYPDDLQGMIRLLAARAGIAMSDFAYAEAQLSAIRRLRSGSIPPDETALVWAQIDEGVGRPEAAMEAYRVLTEKAERPVAVEAELLWIRLASREGKMERNEAVARLETLSVVWRGDWIEVEALGQLGRLYAEDARWREAFTTMRTLNRIFPDSTVTRTLHEDMARLFEDLFLTVKGSQLSRIDALALYFDFKEFTPLGRRGDEIVRKLSDKMVELDLLDQAADLLQYQVDKRLYGAARATVAARLAVIRLMNAKPAEALSVLQSTRLPELPQSIKRARQLLEARALSDLSRTDLALEAVIDEEGPEIERLRADILWQGRRWREAGEAHEKLLGERWQGQEALSERERIDVMRAAIAYSLGDEALALDRIRAKFSGKMADSVDAKTFAFLTMPNAGTSRAFRDMARTVTSAETLEDFLAEYRKRYPDLAPVARGGAREAPVSPPPAAPGAGIGAGLQGAAPQPRG